MKRVVILIIALMLGSACTHGQRSEIGSGSQEKNNLVLREDFQVYFDSCGVEGSAILYDVSGERWIVSDTVGIKVGTLPASTFKIINLLIALETETIKDENEKIAWVGSTDTLKYGYRPEIYHTMSVKEAFELSAGWVFIELARKIGKDRYRDFLARCGYGNNDLSHSDVDFWNFGSLKISPEDQVLLLHGLYKGTLPFSKRNQDIVKRAMITEQNDQYTIRSKTGWTRDNNMNTGWWPGYIETKGGVYVFATRLLQDRDQKRPDFGQCRKDITLKIFKLLRII